MSKIVYILLSIFLQIMLLGAPKIDTVFGEYDHSTSKNRLSQQLSIPQSIAFDNSGQLYIVDTGNNKIRVILPSEEVITVVGSNYQGDKEGAPLYSELKLPTDIVFNSENEMIIADTYNHKIKKLTKDKRVITIAGTGKNSFNGDKYSLDTDLSYPKKVKIYENEIYFVDTGNHRVRKITKNGDIETVVGNGSRYIQSDMKMGMEEAKLYYPTAIEFYGKHLYIADRNGTMIHKVFLKTTKNILHIAGNGKINENQPIDISKNPKDTHIGSIQSIFINQKTGEIYFVSSTHNSILKYKTGDLDLFAGSGNYEAFFKIGPPEKSGFHYPTDFIIKDDVAYIADKRNNYIREIKNNIVSIYVGMWQTRDNLKTVFYPNGITSDSKHFYISDALNYRVIQTDLDFKNPQTVAGTGEQGEFLGYDEKLAKETSLNFISAISYCGGQLFLADYFGNRVWRVENLLLNRVKEIIVFNPSDFACYKDELYIAADRESEILIYNPKTLQVRKTDVGLDYHVKKIDVFNDKIWFTDAEKNGIFQYSNGKSELLTDKIKTPIEIKFVETKNSLYISDAETSKIYQLSLSNSLDITPIVGDGRKGFNKHRGEPTEISIYEPQSIYYLKDNLYVADTINNLIRVIPLNEKIIRRKLSESNDSGCSFNIDSNISLFTYILLGIAIVFISFFRKKEISKNS
ncbi:hypothetical protein JXR93_06345 [bacterium]|nr:hypothetical protein [bacterium]